MIVIAVVLVVLILAFGLVILVGAPYMPTLKRDCVLALELLNLKPGQKLVDLGCGDGIMLKLAAEAGLNAVGYEINPALVLIARARTLRYRRRVKIKWGSFWQADLGGADGVFVFLLDRYMVKLDKKLKAELKPGTKLVSHAFKIPGKVPLQKSGALFLYKY